MRHDRVLLFVATLLASSHAAAIDAAAAYGHRTTTSDVILPLGDDLFGDQVSHYTGTTTFAVTDVSLRGNSALPVAIGRTHTAGAKGGKFGERVHGPEAPGLFGEWDLDIPYLHGVFSHEGWQVVGNTPTARCSAPTSGATMRPPDLPFFYGDAFWDGHFLHVPGQADQRMLLATTALADRPHAGAAYRWNTAQHWYFSCTTQQNGAGEGFLAHAPDGTRYRFDWLVHQKKEPWSKRTTRPESHIGLMRGFLYPTRVEDRFGNWVAYAWVGDELRSIRSSDGRMLTLEYIAAGSGLSAGPKIGAINDGKRTWRYKYGANGFLQQVTLPDGSAWTLQTGVPNYETAFRDYQDPDPDGCDVQRIHYPQPMVYRMTHPQGAVGEFVFEPTMHGRARVAPRCQWDWTRKEDRNRAARPQFIAISLKRKAISGPAMADRTWTIAYSRLDGSWADCVACNTIKQVDVTDNAGTFARYYFSMHFGVSEGRLLERHDGRDGEILRKTWYHIDTAALSPAPHYARVLGHAGDYWGKSPTDEMQLPQYGRDIVQDGVVYSSRVEKACAGTFCFDRLGRPMRVVRDNSLGSRKIERTVFHDDTRQWVLGQVLNSSTNDIETTRVDYDPTTGLPLRRHAFGKLDESWTYHADGTVATIMDANGHITTLSNWKRGIPQQRRFAPTTEAPDGAIEATVVNDDGTIASVTTADGAKTCYAHDAMGRVSRITYPAAVQAGVCDASARTPTTISFIGGHGAAYGVPAGHWRQTTQTGDERHVVIFDALRRPILEQSLDLADPANSLQEVIRRYDDSGRPSFVSLPVNTGGQAHYATGELHGAHTRYDGLGRVTRVEQDSELGKLATTTIYLTGGRTQVTNPRGHATTTTYQAFDLPEYHLPIRIDQPEGVRIDIARDVFGNALRITRSGAGE